MNIGKWIESLLNRGSNPADSNSLSFVAESVHARQLQATLKVVVHDSPSIVVAFEGDPRDIKGIEVTETKGVVTILDTRMVESVSASGLCVAGTNNEPKAVKGSALESSIKVIVKVPRGTAIGIYECTGEVGIGDIEGQLDIAGCNLKIRVGRMAEVTINSQGSLDDIIVREAKGNLEISTNGGGKVHVSNGDVYSLVITIVDAGTVTFGGSAENAKFTILSHGEIRADFVENSPCLFVVGSGTIKVGNWPGIMEKAI